MLWFVLLSLLVGSALLSASETALFALDRQTMSAYGRSEKRLRRRVWRLMRTPRRVLMTVLMANTVINVSIFALSFFLFRSLKELPPALSALASLSAPLAVVIFGEMLPKTTALSHARKIAPLAGSLIEVSHTVLAPFRWILGTFLVEPIIRLLAPPHPPHPDVSPEELQLLVEQSAREGVISSTENDMLQAVVALGHVSVREVMTPRVDIRAIPWDATPAQRLQTARETLVRRLPVYGRNLDDIKGILYTRSLYLQPDRSPRELMRRVHFVPEQAHLMQVLRHFRREGVHLAVVVDEYGGTSGLVTIDDILQFLVGELPEVDVSHPVTTERLDDDTYRLSGNLSIRVWAERFGVGEIDRHIDTVAGLVLSRLGRIPQPGDTVHVRNLTLTVERVERRRIASVLLHRRPQTRGPDDEGDSC